MNKLYIASTSKTLEFVDVLAEKSKVQITLNKNEANILLYVVDVESKITMTNEIFESAKNPDVHTLFHILPEGMDYYQKKALTEFAEELKEYGVFTFVDNDILKSVEQVHSIARIFEPQLN